MEGLGVDCPKQNVGIKQVGKISKEYRGTCDQQACRNLKLIGEENEGDQNLSGPETKLNKKEYERNEPNSTSHLREGTSSRRDLLRRNSNEFRIHDCDACTDTKEKSR